jgi:2-polyprenyl-6-methoxyphenol hydroxylase-like FAD-dependent oxidoreductase
MQFQRPAGSLEELAAADLIVGADGVNSMVRRNSQKELGASVGLLTNKFSWYGTTKRFETLTQTFRRNDDGAFNAHHYRYSRQMSTFIVETDAGTWQRAGFGSMDGGATKTYLEKVFADVLDGHPLVSNQSVWRNFPVVQNRRWSAGKAVLLGDALHTAHFSIGSGTRLALEDAIALARAIGAHPGDPADAGKADRGGKRERAMVRKLREPYGAGTTRVCDELYHSLRARRSQ